MFTPVLEHAPLLATIAILSVVVFARRRRRGERL